MSTLKAAGKPSKPVYCDACGHEFPQDPPFSVPCPQCHAPAGQYCKRPSGHQGPFVPFHAERDLEAFKQGFYDHKNKRGKSCGKQSHEWETLAYVIRQKQKQEKKVEALRHILNPQKAAKAAQLILF